MKRKLEIHLLPHFGHIPVTDLTSRDVEAYLDRKLAENRRIEAALAIGEPLVDSRGRAIQPLRPQTINSHLHLLTEILARALREGRGVAVAERRAPGARADQLVAIPDGEDRFVSQLDGQPSGAPKQISVRRVDRLVARIDRRDDYGQLLGAAR